MTLLTSCGNKALLLKELLHIKYGDRNLKLLQEFDYAIEHDYVDKFYLGCKGC